MRLKQSNKSFIRIIKLISTTLMIAAIGLEIWHIYAVSNSLVMPEIIDIVIWVERLAVIIHFIEGVVAGFFASRRNLNIIKSGIYTFFTGTVGLLEIWGIDNSANNLNV